MNVVVLYNVWFTVLLEILIHSCVSADHIEFLCNDWLFYSNM